MILGSQPILQDLIVAVCARSPKVTAAELSRQITKTGRRCSMKAIYKALGVLQETGIVVKFGKTYSLKLPWVMDMLNFADLLEKSYFSLPGEADIPRAGAKKNTWQFPNLAQLDKYWTQLIVALAANSKSRCYFDYVPHPWFLLIHHLTESQFLRAMERLGCQFYRIIGGRTKLDKSAERYWKQVPCMHWSLAESPFEAQRRVSCGAIDDWVLKVTISKSSSRIIDQLYQRDTLPAGESLSVFYTRSWPKMTLEHNPREAKQLKREFRAYFGLKKES